jgi:hypothetical protein
LPSLALHRLLLLRLLETAWGLVLSP